MLTKLAVFKCLRAAFSAFARIIIYRFLLTGCFALQIFPGGIFHSEAVFMRIFDYNKHYFSAETQISSAEK